MKANELRIGNLYYYEVQDCGERWLEPSVIDVHDLLYLDTFPDDPCFQPMTITEETILLLGAKPFAGKTYHLDSFKIAIFQDGAILFLGSMLSHRIKVGQYIHNLQNIYFALTGTDLPTANFKLPTES